jgi:hypothetical protein
LRARADREIGITMNMAPTDPARLERYAAAGVERVIFEVPQIPKPDVEQRLEEIRTAMGDLAT